MPIDDVGEGVVILTTDPEHLRLSHASQLFADKKLQIKITTRQEFIRTVD
nr:hypothetical protein [uncultured Deefgea sp.]